MKVQMRSRKARTVMTRMKAATFPGGKNGSAEVIVLIPVDIAAVQDDNRKS